MKILARKLWLFSQIVWRRFPLDERIAVSTAWEVAGCIWDEDPIWNRIQMQKARRGRVAE